MAWTYVITINKMLKKYKDQSRYIVVYCAKIPKIFQQSMDDEIDMFSTKLQLKSHKRLLMKSH